MLVIYEQNVIKNDRNIPTCIFGHLRFICTLENLNKLWEIHEHPATPLPPSALGEDVR